MQRPKIHNPKSKCKCFDFQVQNDPQNGRIDLQNKQQLSIKSNYLPKTKTELRWENKSQRKVK